MALNLENYNQQMASIQGQIAAMQNQKPAYQPPILPTPSPPPEPHQLKYVDGPDGAREFQDNLPSNSSDVVFDKNDDVFYVVSKDANGVPPKKLTKGRFTLEYEVVQEPIYVTKQDLEAMEARLMAALTPKTTEEKK